MVRKRAYFLDAGYAFRGGQSYVTLIVRGKRASRLRFRYDPYFYVDAPPERAEVIAALAAGDRNRNTGKEETVKPLRVEPCEKTVFGKKKTILKVFCRKPQHVPMLKSLIPYQCYEYNIPFFRRFMIDFQLTPFSLLVYERKGKVIEKFISITPATPQLKSMAFDIETYNPQGAPREKKDPVIMISYADAEKSEVLTYKKAARDFVRTLSEEREMMQAFLEVLRRKDPDILYGYNSANFDIPYLTVRAGANALDFNLGRGNGPMKVVKKGLVNGLRLDGRIHLDIYPAVRFFGVLGIIKAQSFTLDAVATEVLGKKKKAIQKLGIWDMWDKGTIDGLAEYSLTDAKITYELGEMVLPLLMELASVTKMTLFDVSLATSGQLVESLLMYNAFLRNEIVPGKPNDAAVREREANPIKGAFVKIPEPGLYENIAVLDFRGLYPSIIVSYNIDPFTVVSDAADPAKASAGGNGGEGILFNQSPTGAKFAKGALGLIPASLDELLNLRAGLKKRLRSMDKSSPEYTRLSARVQAIKILSNSFYGYLGYARSRWYNRECAESTTAWGRKHIQDAIDAAEKAGFRVLYADTDSTFLLMEGKKKEEVLGFLDSVNRTLPEKMELELEGFYTRGVFVSKKTAGKDKDAVGAKKKYAMLGEDGRIKIRGFELVRRDWSQIAKDTQMRVLQAILREGSKEKAVKIVYDVVERLKGGKVPLEELAISTQLNKDPEHYEVMSPELSAAKKAMSKGVLLEQGSLISYVITKNGKTISEKAESIEFAKDYDPDYYINNQVMPAVLKILKELGYDESDLKSKGKQQNLGSFFG